MTKKVSCVLSSFFSLLAAFLLLPLRSYSQAISGDLVGTVIDSSGAVVPNASLMAENTATGFKANETTNAAGEFHFSNLPVGTYKVTVTATGFAAATVNGVAVQLNKENTLPVTMQLQAQTTTVEVTGAPPSINTTSPQIEGTFEAAENANLPVAVIGDGVINLALLQPGVSAAEGIGAGTGPSVGGQRPYNNNFMIEGVDNNDKAVTGPLVYVPNDAVEEFSALQNQFSPEFGHSTGGQFNTIVMSGTNQYHGKVYEYFQNRHLNAIDQDVIQSGLTSNPRYDWNRVGGQVGGPIKKNKLFFFGNFEYNPLGQASVAAGGVCSPTAAGYTTLGSLAAVSKTNLGILQKYLAAAPVGGNCPTTGATIPVAGANIPVGLIPISAPNYTNWYYLVTSMDYDISSKDQIRGRYIYNRNTGLDIGAQLPAFFLTEPVRYDLIALSEYHTFTPNLTNEFRIGFNRYSQVIPAGNFQFPGLDSFPNLEFFDLNVQLGQIRMHRKRRSKTCIRLRKT